MFKNSMFSPASPHALAVTHLSYIVFGVLAAILALIIVLVTYAVIKFRRRPGAPEPPQVFGSAKMEKIWTFGSVAVVTFFAVLTIRTMFRSSPTPPRGEKPNLIIVGHQWWWYAKYPESGVVTANEIHIPVGQDWLILLKAGDVIHDFWVPDLGPKTDAIPGHPNKMWIEANKPGTYLGACAEYCGAEHAWMRIRVIAQPEAEFKAWEQHQLEVPAKPTAGAALAGSKLFNSLTCGDCHTVAGTTANGEIGPDLTHVASRETLAAGRLINTPENMAKWISDPQKYKPGCYMPNFNFNKQQVKELAAYLETLK